MQHAKVAEDAKGKMRRPNKGERAKTEDWIYHGSHGWRKAQSAGRKAQSGKRRAQGGKRKAQGGKRGSAVALTMRFGSLMASPTANAPQQRPRATDVTGKQSGTAGSAACGC